MQEREARFRSNVVAELRDSDRGRDIRIIDVSTRGLLAVADNPPRRGEFVEITVGRNRLAGRVKWSRDGRFGIALRDRVSIPEIRDGGVRPVQLVSTRAAKGRSGSMAEGLRANPVGLGRVLQLGGLVLAAGVAAFWLAQVMNVGFEPVQDAVLAMNTGAGAESTAEPDVAPD